MVSIGIFRALGSKVYVDILGSGDLCVKVVNPLVKPNDF